MSSSHSMPICRNNINNIYKTNWFSFVFVYVKHRAWTTFGRPFRSLAMLGNPFSEKRKRILHFLEEMDLVSDEKHRGKHKFDPPIKFVFSYTARKINFKTFSAGKSLGRRGRKTTSFEGFTLKNPLTQRITLCYQAYPYVMFDSLFLKEDSCLVC